MSVLREIDDGHFAFKCDGCGREHQVWTDDEGQHPSWTFNGDLNEPTFSPSIRVETPGHNKYPTLCHLFIRNGKIQFLNDCKHHLAGQTVEMRSYTE